MLNNHLPKIALITPALAAENNGNWHTARRWAAHLAADFDCDIALRLEDLPHPASAYCAMIALHARRSAASMVAFKAQLPAAPVILALTGTDLYRDIAVDPAAQHSLALADRLIVLQSQGQGDVPAQYRHKTQVVYQSYEAPPSDASKQKNALFEVLVVGHLRAEKSPETVFAVVVALAALDAHVPIRITHIGKGLDADLAAQATALQASHPAHYRWLGGLAHEATLAQIAQCDVLLHPSIMEGGANVIIEAVQHATPVIASRVAGNVGMLGEDYAGYFPVQDVAACAALVQRASEDALLVQQLQAQCQLRSHRFAPQAEQAALLAAVLAALQLDKPTALLRS